jgi:hypothetical protein
MSTHSYIKVPKSGHEPLNPSYIQSPYQCVLRAPTQRRRNLMGKSQPKARFSNRLANGDFLTLAIWPGKKDPKAEVLTVQIRRSTGEGWETVGRLAVYRTGDGNYSQLPERQPLRKETETISSISNEREDSEDEIDA